MHPPSEASPDPSLPPSAGEKDFVILDLPGVLTFFFRRWKRIVGASLAAALLTAVVVLFVLPAQYEAAATLMVIPPQFSSQLKPETLSIQGYQRLLESDAVVALTVRRLRDQGILDPNGQIPKLGDDLNTRIFVSRRAEETVLAPVVEAVARAETAEVAAAIANTWAEVFLDRILELNAGSTDPTVQFIETQYSLHYKKLVQLEDERIDVADGYQVRLDDLAIEWLCKLDDLRQRWDRRLVTFEQETEDLIAAYQVVTREAMEGLVADGGLSETNGGEDGGGKTGDPRRALEREQKLREVTTLRIQLAQTPPLVILEKAISDDALWQALTLGSGQLTDLQPLSSRSLVTQEINPVHGELTLRLSELEVELEALAVEDGERTESLVAGLEKLQRERSAGLAKLIAERSLESDEIQSQKTLELETKRRQRDQGLTALMRDRDTHLQQLDRDLGHARTLFSRLAEGFGQAEIARAERGLADVRLGGPAVVPLRPVPSRWALKALLGLIAGGFFGTMAAWLQEVGAS